MWEYKTQRASHGTAGGLIAILDSWDSKGWEFICIVGEDLVFRKKK